MQNFGELESQKGELVSNRSSETFSNVINLKLWTEAKLWYETDRKLGKHSTSIKEYYLDFLKFEQGLVHGKKRKAVYKEADIQRRRKRDSK